MKSDWVRSWRNKNATTSTDCRVCKSIQNFSVEKRPSEGPAIVREINFKNIIRLLIAGDLG